MFFSYKKLNQLSPVPHFWSLLDSYENISMHIYRKLQLKSIVLEMHTIFNNFSGETQCQNECLKFNGMHSQNEELPPHQTLCSKQLQALVSFVLWLFLIFTLWDQHGQGQLMKWVNNQLNAVSVEGSDHSRKAGFTVSNTDFIIHPLCNLTV